MGNQVMLYVKTQLKASNISGIGLFADEIIPKGTIVWKFDPIIDLLLSRDEIKNLSQPAQDQIYKYGFLDNNSNKYMLCGDDARFFNHSTNNNCDDSQIDITVAKRNIMPGEELTVNYRDFYGDVKDLNFLT
jgi:uncharacterized protein